MRIQHADKQIRGEKNNNILGEKTAAHSKQSWKVSNWDPVDNEEEGWFGNEKSKDMGFFKKYT